MRWSKKRGVRISDRKNHYKVITTKQLKARRPTVREAARLVVRGYAQAFRELEKY